MDMYCTTCYAERHTLKYCRVIEALLIAAKDSGCYKVILDCAESNSAFYEKCGLTRKEVQMVWSWIGDFAEFTFRMLY